MRRTTALFLISFLLLFAAVLLVRIGFLTDVIGFVILVIEMGFQIDRSGRWKTIINKLTNSFGIEKQR